MDYNKGGFCGLSTLRIFRLKTENSILCKIMNFMVFYVTFPILLKKTISVPDHILNFKS